MSRLPAFPDWSFPDFTMATRAVLEYLHERLGFQMWMVTRTDGVDAVVLQSFDHGYGMGSGDEFRWSDSYCARMVTGHAPRVAPAIRNVPAYADAPITQQMEIGAYMGVPLTRSDGTLFGTLCAMDPDAQSDDLLRELPSLELAARLLSTVLDAELKAADAERRAERAEDATTVDPLTNLVNRKGWERSIGREEERCARFGSYASVVWLDLDGVRKINESGGRDAGDEYIKRAARSLQTAARSHDLVARIHDDEFALLAVECGTTAAAALARRVLAALSRKGVRASLGVATRSAASGGLEKACAEAAAQMARVKALKARRS